jgi:hypothetical protein
LPPPPSPALPLQTATPLRTEIVLDAAIQDVGAIGSPQRSAWEGSFVAGLAHVLSVDSGRLSVAYVRAASVAVGCDIYDRLDGAGLPAADAIQYLLSRIARGDVVSIGSLGAATSASVATQSQPPVAINGTSTTLAIASTPPAGDSTVGTAVRDRWIERVR